MNKNFGYVENKVLETDFHFKNFELTYKSNNIFESNCYFNAFLSAARSITMVLQYVMKEVEGFNEWYNEQVSRLKEYAIFKDSRNDSIHQGKDFVFTTHWNFNEDNNEMELETFFQSRHLNQFRSKISKDI